MFLLGSVATPDNWPKQPNNITVFQDLNQQQNTQKSVQILLELLCLIIFEMKSTFFTFIDAAIQKTESYIRSKKKEWFSYFKAYYTQAQIILGKDWLINIIYFNFDSKL